MFCTIPTQIVGYAPAGREIGDRSFIFPIYSGMFFLLKYGVLCEPSEMVATEIDLVDRFVKETERHGDPVHYGRALAMQGETCHRLGKFEDAIESHMKLKQIYNIDEHSARIVASYASDRCAQNYGSTAFCYVRLGENDKALEICDYIEHHIMPKMDPKNVHNSTANIMSSLWIWRANGMSARSLSAFQRHVLEPFDQYFGKDGSTPFQPLFSCLTMLLTLDILLEKGELETVDESYFEWVMDMANMEGTIKMENSLGNFGRGQMSVNAELCLILSKITEDPERKMEIIANGVNLANLSLRGLDGSDGSPRFETGYAMIQPVHSELTSLYKYHLPNSSNAGATDKAIP